ncbi:MAG: hypothetical protein ACI9RG_000811 [Sulfurimonas sp.]|jgi:hypothetical protein
MKTINRIILALMLVNSIGFAKSVATITAITGSADIVRGGANIEATLGAELNEKDNILTKNKSKVQIIFNDETIITVGKNSNFSINEFIFDDSQEPKAKFGLLSGAMRTITGKIGKIAPDRFSVKTKTATIGIRGTNFSVLAGADGSTRVFCTFGAISVNVKEEVSIVTQGFYVVISPTGERGTPIKFTPKALKKMRSDSFTNTQVDKKEISTTLNEVSGSIESNDVETPVDAESGSVEVLVADITDVATDTEQTTKTADAIETDSTTPVVTTPVVTTLTIPVAGWAINSVSSDTTALGALSITQTTTDGSISGAVFSASTIVDTVGNDTWTYTLATSPTTYVSKEKFDVAIDTITTTTAGVSNIVLKSTGNYLKATGDDLSSDDSMSWGEWSINTGYKAGDSSLTKNVTGLWVAGEATPLSILNGYKSTLMGATYSGKYRAIVVSDSSIVNGDARLEVDFGNNQAALYITANTSGTKISGTLNISGSINDTTKAISGGSSESSSFQGTFYGSDGKSVGGNFIIFNAPAINAKGVYEVKTSDIHTGGNSNAGG